MELVTIRLPEELKKKLEEIAQEQHRPLSNLVRLALIQWLEEQEGKGAKKK